MHPTLNSRDCTLKGSSDCEPDHPLSKRQRTGDNKIQKVAESSLSSQMYKKGNNYWDAEVNEPLFQKYPDLRPLWPTPTSIKLYIYEGIDTNSPPKERIIPYCKLTKVSDHFKRVFEGNCGKMLEKQTLTLPVCGHRVEVIDWVIAEVYDANQKPLNEDNVFEIYRLVDYWEIPKILNECRTYLIGLAEVNVDLFIKTVELFAAYHDMDNLEEVFIRNHRHHNDVSELFKSVIAIYEIMNEHEFKMTSKILIWFLRSISEITNKHTDYWDSITIIHKIGLHDRISDDKHMYWKTRFVIYFFEKLRKKLNSASESEIEKVKNKIMKNDLTPFFEEVTLYYDSKEGLENLVDVICLFPENVKSIFIHRPFGKNRLKYKDIENCTKNIIPKLKQFKNLEMLYFANKRAYHDLLPKLDFTQYPKLREIGQFKTLQSSNCYYAFYNNSLETRSGYVPPGKERSIFKTRKDRDCTKAFENLLKSVTKQRHLKTLLNKGLLTIRFGYQYYCPLTPFRLFNLCDDYNISHTRIYGLEKKIKKSFRNLKARSIIIPAHIPTDIRSVSHYLTSLNG